MSKTFHRLFQIQGSTYQNNQCEPFWLICAVDVIKMFSTHQCLKTFREVCVWYLLAKEIVHVSRSQAPLFTKQKRPKLNQKRNRCSTRMRYISSYNSSLTACWSFYHTIPRLYTLIKHVSLLSFPTPFLNRHTARLLAWHWTLIQQTFT